MQLPVDLKYANPAASRSWGKCRRAYDGAALVEAQ